MADLELKVKSTGAQQAERDLKAVSAAADKAAQSAEKLSATTTKASTAVAKTSGLTAFQLTNLSYQMNDITTGLLTGQSPFMIMAQQGGQVYQILSNAQGGIGGALKDLQGRIVSFLGPIGLMAAGFGAISLAAYGYYRLTREEVPTADQLLERHTELLKLVRESYDRTTQSANKFYQQSKAVTQLQLLQQQIDLQRQLREEVGKFIQVTTKYDASQGFGALFNRQMVVRDPFVPFEDAIIRLQEAMKSGNPDIKTFNDEVARIAGNDAALQKAGAKLIRNAEEAMKFSFALRQVNASMNILNGTASKEDRGIVGGGFSSPSQLNSYQQFTKRIQDRIEVLKTEAATAGQSGAALTTLKVQLDAENAARKAHVAVNQKWLDQKKEEIVLLERRAAVASLQSDISFDRSQIGLTDAEQRANGQLRSIFGNDLSSAQAQFLSRQLQVNDALRDMNNTGRGAFSSFIVDISHGTNALTAMGSALSRIADKLLDMAAQQLWASAFGGTGGSFLSSFFPGSSPIAAAAGGGGGMGIGLTTTSTLYANGGVPPGRGISAFSNQIVDRPTIFPFAKGIGLMGEAGAEAIMPLTRIGGKLGVRAESSGGGSGDININIGTISLPQDNSGDDPTGAKRAAEVAKALDRQVRAIVHEENIKGYRQGGMHNRGWGR